MKSKHLELLSEVFKREISEIEEYDGTTLRLTGEFDGFRQKFFFNVHELAHKCKEWALDKGYIIEIGVHPTANIERRYFSTIKTFPGAKLVKSSKTGEDTINSYERVFADCQWILGNKLEVENINSIRKYKNIKKLNTTNN